MDTLGLGIRLEIIDQTLQATNRILSNMERLQNGARQTAGAFNDLNSSALHMNSLMEAGFALGFAGDNVLKGGQAIIGTMGKIGGAVIKTGAQFESFRKTLEALYKDPKIVEQKLSWVMDYAASTPFEITDLVKNMIGFKAIQVDIDKKVKNMAGQEREFISYVGDLAALRPDQGLSGILVAVREMMSGQNMSFKRRLEVDPNKVLGYKFRTDTMENSLQDVAIISEKLAGGLMDKLRGTWNVMLTNMKEQGVRVLLAIADSGAFDAAKRTLGNLFMFLENIDDERIKKIGQSLSGIFTVLWKPIDLAAEVALRLAAAFEDLATNHPLLSKLIVVFIAITGVILLTVGATLKLVGGLMLTGAAITQLIVNYGALTGKTLAMEAAFMRVVRWTRIFFATVAVGSLIIGGALFAYTQNLFGFRDAVDGVLKKYSDGWKKVNVAIKDGDIATISHLNRLEKFMASAIMIGDVIKTIFTMDDGENVIFSEKQYKLLNSLGLWDVAVKLVMLKARLEAFFTGFEKGVAGVLKFGGMLVEKVFKPIGKFFTDHVPTVKRMADAFTDFFGIKIGESGDLVYWEKLGVIIGALVVSLLGLKAIKGLASIIISPFVAIAKNLLGIKKTIKDVTDIANKPVKSSSSKTGGMNGGCCCCCDDTDGTKKGKGAAGGATPIVAAGGLGGRGGDTDVVGGGALGPRSDKHGKRMKGLKGLLNRLFGGNGMVTNVADNADDIANGAAKVGKFSKFLKGIPYIGAALGLAAGGATIWAGAKDSGLQDSLGKSGGGVAGSVTGGVVGGIVGSMILPGVGTAVGAVAGSMAGDWLGGLMDKGGWTKSIVDGAVWLWDTIKGAFTGGVKWVSDKFNFLVDSAKKVSKNLPYFIGYAMGRVTRWLGETGAKIIIWAAKTWNGFIDWAKKVPDRLQEAFREAPEKTMKFILALGVRLYAWKEEMKKSFKNFATNVGESIVNAFMSIGPSLKKAWTGTIDWLGEQLDYIGGIGSEIFRGFKDGFLKETPQPDKKYANGGILTSPHVGLVAEEGPEGIIPLNPNRRGRALDLYRQVGQHLGVRPYAEGGIVGKKAPTAAGGTDNSVTINNLHVNIHGGPGATGKPEDVRAHAKMLLVEMKKLLKEDRLRGGSKTLEDLVLGM